MPDHYPDLELAVEDYDRDLPIPQARPDLDRLLERVAELEEELKARRALDEWRRGGDCRTVTDLRHGAEWWLAAHDATVGGQRAIGSTPQQLADALGLKWRE